MKNNRIVLNGTEKEVQVVGMEALEVGTMDYIVVAKTIEALNDAYILEDLETDGTIEVSSDGDIVTVNGNEYLAIEGEERANQRAIDYIIEIFEDCGLGDNLITIANNHGFIDEDWFTLAQKESYESYMDDIETERATNNKYSNRLEEEIKEANCDTREEYLEMLCEDEAVDWFKFNFGEKEFERVLIENNLIDLEELATYCVEVDGRGYTLASYDGKEIEYNDFYLYRVN